MSFIQDICAENKIDIIDTEQKEKTPKPAKGRGDKETNTITTITQR